MSVLEEAIDNLYQLPPGEFTAARNRLAKTLTGEERERVRRLEKPSAVPWAINQLYWRARAHYDRVLKAGANLRTAQIDALEGRPGRVPKASSAHRQALADATTRAIALASEAAVKVAAEPLSRMLEALSLASDPPDPPGRLVDIIQLSGFEALAGVRPAAPPPPPPAKGAPRAKAPTARRDDADEDERLERQRADVARALSDAERALASARERETRERSRVAAARAQLNEAESALDAARAEVEACETALRAARTAAHRARV